MINIDPTGDPAGTAGFSDVFTFDTAVFDPDTPDSGIAWVFAEDVTGLTVSGSLFTVNGIGPVADPATPRPTSDTNNLRSAGTTFSIATDDVNAGQSPSTATYAGTTAAAVAGDTVFATITVAVSDDTNVTQKDVVVKVNAGAGDSVGGVSDLNVYATTLDTGANHSGSGWTQDPGNIIDSAVTVNYGGATVALNLTNPPADGLGFGFAQSTEPFNGTTLGPGLFALEPGKVYRVRTTVTAPGNTNALQAQDFRLRFGITGTTFPANSTMEASPAANSGSLTPAGFGAGGHEYEVLFETPTNARLAGQLHTTDAVQLFYDAIVYGPTIAARSGSLAFANTTIDSFDAPGLGSNGALRVFSTFSDWNSPAFGSINDVADTNAANNAGWKFRLQNLNFGAPFPNSIASLVANATTAQTSVTFGTGLPAASSNTVQLFSTVGGTHFSKISYGEPEGEVGNTGTLIPVALLTENGENVYYRVSAIMRSTSANATTVQGFKIKAGLPFSVWMGSMDIGGGSGAAGGPVSSEQTTYSAWLRGMPALAVATPSDTNNFSIVVELIDATADTGGTLVIDTIAIEMFPAAWF